MGEYLEKEFSGMFILFVKKKFQVNAEPHLYCLGFSLYTFHHIQEPVLEWHKKNTV
jgi:hypothetical protein